MWIWLQRLWPTLRPANPVTLSGTVSITGLPPHLGLIINLCFFKVRDANSAPPYNGDPPAEAAVDCSEILNQVDLEAMESKADTIDVEWHVERPSGYYFVQVRLVLFRARGGRPFAQVEQFFFRRRPVRVAPEGSDRITFPIGWPAQPLEELHSYGTVHPTDSA